MSKFWGLRKILKVILTLSFQCVILTIEMNVVYRFTLKVNVPQMGIPKGANYINDREDAYFYYCWFFYVNQRSRMIVCLHQTSRCMPDRSLAGEICTGRSYFTSTQKQQKSKSQKNNERDVSILLNSLACFVFVRTNLQHTCSHVKTTLSLNIV